MSERGIIFSTPMVQALLAGRKTQTRRIIKKPAALDALAVFGPTMLLQPGCADLLPFAPGDRLWVREAWSHTGEGVWTIADARMRGRGRVIYRAEHEEAKAPGPRVDARWWPSIHMPREFSRLTLLVTEVRAQRLQGISEEDAIAEGMLWQEPTEADRQWARDYAEENGGDASIDGVWLAPGTRQGWGMTKAERDRPQWGPTAAFAFRCTWESLHGPGSWEANPWVCVIHFEVAR